MKACGCGCGCESSLEGQPDWVVLCSSCYQEVRYSRHPDAAHAAVIAANRAAHEATAERRQRRRKGGSDR